MKFNRDDIQKNTEDTGERKVLPAGTYRFRVESAVRKKSSKGADMWELQLAFPDVKDARWTYDYFVENEKNLWKFAQFFDCIGSPDDDTDAMKYAFGEEGQVTLVIEHSDEYGDRNKVKRYIPLKKEENKKQDPIEELTSEDLPF